MIYVLLYGLMLTGSVCAAAFGKKRTALSLTMTPLALIMGMYAFALMGVLRPGVYALAAMCAALWAASLAYAAVKKQLQPFMQRLFTPSWAIFTGIFLFCVIFSSHMTVHRWDEFSHWAYSVQEMLLNDQLYTGALSDDLFKGYPPAISLWWYILTVLRGGKSMDGALLYVGMQVFSYSLLMPYTERLSWKRPWRTVLVGVSMLVMPLVVYEVFWQRIYIDTTLGLIAGSVFAMIACGKWKKTPGLITLVLMEMNLVLMKDSGLAFALVSLVYMALAVGMDKKRKRVHWVYVLCVAAGVLLAKGTWTLHLSAMNVAGSSMHVDLNDLWRIIIGRNPDSYRADVARSFIAFLFGHSMRVTAWRLPLSYFLMTMLLLTAHYALQYMMKRDHRAALSLLIGSAVNAVVYIVGQMILYMYFFAPEAAALLPSGSRYLKTLMLCLVVVCAAQCFELLARKQGRGPGWKIACAGMAAMVLLTDQGMVLEHINGGNVRMTGAQAQPFQEAAALVAEKTGADHTDRARVYMVLQCEEDLDFYGMRYYLRPYAQVNCGMWNLGADGNAVTEDMWAYTPGEWSQRIADERVAAGRNVWTMTADMWARQLRDNYDYVLVSKADDYLMETFGSLFADEILPGNLYRVERAEDGQVTLHLL